MINRIRANYNLNELLGKKEYVDNLRCTCGAEEENVNHVVFNCNLYIEEREFMLRKMDKKKNGKYVMDVNKIIQKKRMENDRNNT